MDVDQRVVRLRAICLALPEATEKQAWGSATFRVKDKIFVIERRDGERLGLWCKVPDGMQAVMVEAEPDRFFVPPYLGPKGWIGVVLQRSPDWDAVAALVARSYRLIAPKRLARLVGG